MAAGGVLHLLGDLLGYLHADLIRQDGQSGIHDPLVALKVPDLHIVLQSLQEDLPVRLGNLRHALSEDLLHGVDPLLSLLPYHLHALGYAVALVLHVAGKGTPRPAHGDGGPRRVQEINVHLQQRHGRPDAVGRGGQHGIPAYSPGGHSGVCNVEINGLAGNGLLQRPSGGSQPGRCV